MAYINLKTLQDNALAFRNATGAKLYAVVKADAYGHGAEECVCALSGVADAFVVAIPDEAMAIRTAVCGKDILVLAPPLREEEILLGAKNGWILTISRLGTARRVLAVAKRYGVSVRVHLKVNTGMNRYGADNPSLGKICKALLGSTVRVEGVYSHLYDCNRDTAEAQRRAFIRAVCVCKNYYPNIRAHLSATYGATLGRAFAFDAVRVGLGLYGYLPNGAEKGAVKVQPVMKVYAEVAETRKYRGGGVGYGAKPVLEKGTDLSVYRFGYADGFLWKKENGTLGAEKGVNALCMDACIRKEKRRSGEWVCVMDNAETIANAVDTIPYEVLCAATRRAERAYGYEKFSNECPR